MKHPPAIPMEQMRPAVQRSEAEAAADVSRIGTLVTACSERGMTALELLELLKVSTSTMKRLLAQSSAIGRLVNRREGKTFRWYTPKLLAEIQAPRREQRKAIEPVNIAASPEWLMPAATVEVRDGVRITRQAAPAGRFDSTLRPGHGVISGDAMLRRQGVALPSRIAGYLEQTEGSR